MPPTGPEQEKSNRSKRAALIAGISVLVLLLALGLALLLLRGGGGGGEGGAGGLSGPYAGSGDGTAPGTGGGTGGEGPPSSEEGSPPPGEGQAETTESESEEQEEEGSPTPPLEEAEAGEIPALVFFDEHETPGAAAEGGGGTGGGGIGVGTGTGDGGGGGAPGEGKAEFFGIKAKGRSFVYIVDKSSSMSGLPFREAKAELMRSINTLKENQQFYVFFYASSSFPMPGNRPLQGVPQDKQVCQQWVDTISAGGGTRPRESLLDAINMRPDVIFFMSDGHFRASVCEDVRQAQGKPPITIHTVGFVSRGGEAVLKLLAAENGGVYHFVPGSGAVTPSPPMPFPFPR
ncbi:MAG: VWA domain-containing protein [Candidatus Brocadiae bacterium]|nr:VWA domain-containing protein [Candidatus Brocadiia bacterium]